MTKPEDYINLAKSIVLKYDKKLEDSDLYGIALLSLMKAYNSYDHNKGFFSTWAYKIIKQDVIDELRKNNKKIETIDSFDEISNKEKRILDKNLIYFIDPNEENNKILLDHYIHGKSWANIGRELNLTRESVRKKGLIAIEKIKKEFGNNLDEIEFFYF